MSTIPRRRLAMGAAWALPALSLAAAAPAIAASRQCTPPGLSASSYNNATTGELRDVTTAQMCGSGSTATPYDTLGDGTRRWWQWTDNDSTTAGAANYLTLTRTWNLTQAANAVQADRFYSVSGSVQANFGSNCMPCSSGAGLIVQTNSGSGWVSQVLYTTRPNLASGLVLNYSPAAANPCASTTVTVPTNGTTFTWPALTNSSGCTCPAGVSCCGAATAVTKGTFCNWAGFNNANTNTQTTSCGNGLYFSTPISFCFTLATAATSPMLGVRYINFVAPRAASTCTSKACRDNTNSSIITFTSDDIGATNPRVTCATC